MHNVDFYYLNNDVSIPVPAVRPEIELVAAIDLRDPEFRYLDPVLENFLDEVQQKDGLPSEVRVAANNKGKDTSPELKRPLTMEDEICSAFVKTINERKLPLSESFGVSGEILRSNSPNILLDMAYMSGKGMFERLALELFESYFKKSAKSGLIAMPDSGMEAGSVPHAIWGYQEAIKIQKRLQRASQMQPSCKRALERSAVVFLNTNKLAVLSKAKIDPWTAFREYMNNQPSALDDIKKGLEIVGIDFEKLQHGDWTHWEFARRAAGRKLTAISATIMDQNLEEISRRLNVMITDIEALKEREFSKILESHK